MSNVGQERGDIPRILCSIPCYSSIQPSPFSRFLVFAQESGEMEARGEYSVRFMVAGPRCRTVAARNKAADLAVNGLATHLLFIDDDMIIPKGLLKRLLPHNAPIVGPLFFADAVPPKPLAFDLDSAGHPIPYYDFPENEVFECPGGLGTGCMLISRETLDAIEPPWFRTDDQGCGEDIDFCARARRRGFLTYCDSTVIVGQTPTCCEPVR